MNSLSPGQQLLIKQIRNYFQHKKNYKITCDQDGYLHLDNGKRFYKFHFNAEFGLTYFGIKEDGNTRYVFNGRIDNYDDFLIIDKCATP